MHVRIFIVGGRACSHKCVVWTVKFAEHTKYMLLFECKKEICCLGFDLR